MLQKIKKFLFFPLASYFAFFAKIRLSRWNPRVVVVTGSSGKTSLLHLLEAGLGDKARFSHHANSAIGVPFDILDIKRKSLMFYEWPLLFLSPFFKVFAKLPKEKYYVVEADCDRPGEGKFLSNLLNPEVTLWTVSSRTHSINFEELVSSEKFKKVEDAIAHEFGYFMEKTKNLSIVNGECVLIKNQIPRTKAEVLQISKDDLTSYQVSENGTTFVIKNKKFSFDFVLPEEFFYAIDFSISLFKYLEIEKYDFSTLSVPPGRNSIFKGIKETLLLDSTYNANLSSMTAVLSMFEKIEKDKKWAVIGDMLEQGKYEKEEHEELAKALSKMKLERIILLGPRVEQYTYPKLKKMVGENIVIEKFLNPKDVLVYLRNNIRGGEFILFKGARFMEGVLENLLIIKDDVKYLARREKVWQIRRKKWGL